MNHLDYIGLHGVDSMFFESTFLFFDSVQSVWRFVHVFYFIFAVYFKGLEFVKIHFFLSVGNARLQMFAFGIRI